MTTLARIAAIAGFLGCIVAANYVTTEHGMIDVLFGLGLMATAGTYFAGVTFVLRDTLQRAYGPWWVLVLIAVGVLLSYVLAATVYEANAAFLPPGVTPESIAIGSAVAFGISEIADLIVWTPLERKGYVRAAVASNTVGALVDTILFLWIAGFALTSQVVAGQMVGKLLITAVVVVGVLAWRTRRTAVTA